MPHARSTKEIKIIFTLAVIGATAYLSIITHDLDDQSWHSNCHDARRVAELKYAMKLSDAVQDAESELFLARAYENTETIRMLQERVDWLTKEKDVYLEVTGKRSITFIEKCKMGNSMRAIQNQWPVDSDGKPESYDHHWRWSRLANRHE